MYLLKKEKKMIDLKEVNFAQLKTAVKALNESGVLEELKIKALRTVGVKKEAIAKEFISVLDKAAKKDLDDMLTDEIVEMYNYFFSDEKEKGEPKDEETPKTDPKKKAEPKKTDPEKKPADKAKKKESAPDKKKRTRSSAKVKKEKDVSVKKDEKDAPAEKEKKGRGEKSVFGHMMSSDTGLMDGMFAEGTTFTQLSAILDVEKNAISRHIRRLRKKGFIVTKKNDDADTMSVIYKVKAPTKK